MKVFANIVKILTALAAVAGAIYIVATYGDKIVAWAKKMLGECKCCGECACEEAVEAEEVVEAAEETAEVVEEAAEAAEEAPAEEIPEGEGEVVATEADFQD